MDSPTAPKARPPSTHKAPYQNGHHTSPNEDSLSGDIFSVILIFASWVAVVCTFPLSIIVCLKVAQEYERVVVFR